MALLRGQSRMQPKRAGPPVLKPGKVKVETMKMAVGQPARNGHHGAALLVLNRYQHKPQGNASVHISLTSDVMKTTEDNVSG